MTGDSKSDMIMPPGTIRLHRVLRTKPGRVYRAFLDAEAMAKWLPPYGFTCKQESLAQLAQLVEPGFRGSEATPGRVGDHES
jgi:uncharacterized protein YndB with AHSA1/START domain